MGEISKALSKLTQVAINMIVPILMCLFLGKWLDQKFETGVVFLFIFLVLGIASAFRNLYVFVIKDFSNEQKKEEESGYLNLNDYDADEEDDDYNKN
ncbi:MAG: AtpZ/AtpI family protein [bacterium]